MNAAIQIKKKQDAQGQTHESLDLDPLQATFREYLDFLRGGLHSEYQERTRALLSEESALNAEAEKLEKNQGRLKTILAARVRVLERQADELTASGKIEEGARKGQELDTAKKDLETLSARLQVIDQRLERIERQKVEQANGAVSVFYRHMRFFCLMALEQTFDAIIEIEKTLVDFGGETEAHISRMNHIGRLRPYNVSSEGQWVWEKVFKVFPEIG